MIGLAALSGWDVAACVVTTLLCASWFRLPRKRMQMRFTIMGVTFLILLALTSCSDGREVVVDYVDPDERGVPVVTIMCEEVRAPYAPTPGGGDDPPLGPNLHNPNPGLEQITLRWTTGGKPYVIKVDTYQWGSAVRFVRKRAVRAWKRNPPDKVSR